MSLRLLLGVSLLWGLCAVGVSPSAAQPVACSISFQLLTADDSGYRGRPVEFLADARLAHCNTSGPIVYDWDFGDGEHGSGLSTWHKYNAGGTYTWSVTASVPGASALGGGSVVVSPDCICTQLDSVDGPYGRDAGEPVTFQLIPPADCCQTLPSIEWNFGDQTPVVTDTLSTQHVYAQPGVYRWQVSIDHGSSVTFNDLAIGPDLVADRIEVVQTVQDLNNSVRLVAEKPTFVRFYAHSAQGRYPVSARLSVQGPDSGAFLYPINPGGQVTVRPRPSRAALDHVFLFEIPNDLLHGDVRIDAELNPFPFGPLIGLNRPAERDAFNDPFTPNNNHVATAVAFEPVPRAYLVLYNIDYQRPDGRYSASEFHQRALTSWMRRAYPIASLGVLRRTYDYGLRMPTCEEVNGELAEKRMWDMNNRWFFVNGISTSTRYYGMVDDGGGFMRGCAMGIPSYVASGPTGSTGFAWDTDGSYGDWYGGHELGHTWNRYHAEFCGASAKDWACVGGARSGLPCDVDNPCPGGACQLVAPPGYVPFPYPQGYISSVNAGDTALFGFDALTRVIYGPTWNDLMTYCDYVWMSDVTFEGLMDRIQSEGDTSGAPVPAAAETTDRLLVVGSIDAATNATRLKPLFIMPSAAEVRPRVPGAYAIVLRDTTNAEVARYPFTPSASDIDSPLPDGVRAQRKTVLFIEELVPYIVGTTRVDIEGPSGVLASVHAGAATPSVHLLSPNGGEVLGGATIPVSWSASDADGDALTFNVQYSRDNGSSWEMIAQNLSATSVVLDAINFPSGSRARMRVWASDGIHTAADQSDATFTVPNHGPNVSIVEPASNVTIAVGQTLQLAGSAYDVDTGSVPDDLLTWSSDVDGYLGSGIALALTLSEGVHTITFTADDGRGGGDSASVQVTVVATMIDLPATPDALAVAPTLVALAPASGVTSADVSIDNRNAGQSLAWNATASETWLHLSESAGVTPSEMSVSLTASLFAGTHHATITFTSPGAPQLNQTIDVQVTVPGPPPVCTGDCNRNGPVSMSELIAGIDTALGQAALDDCLPFDADGDTRVNIDDLVLGVRAASYGCLLE